LGQGVRRLPSGRYQVRFSDAGGTRHTAPDTFASRREAVDYLAMIRAEMFRGTWRAAELGAVTVADYPASLLARTFIGDRRCTDSQVPHSSQIQLELDQVEKSCGDASETAWDRLPFSGIRGDGGVGVDDVSADQLPQLLTSAELAERWGCSTGWLANMRSVGVGPPFLKLGSNVRYRVPDVIAYENSCCTAV
jgi:hypothetical protein